MRVWLALAMIVFGFGGLFAVVGYITPLMTHDAGLSKAMVLPVLAILGLGMVTGTRLVDVVTRCRGLLPVIRAWLVGLIVVLLLFSLLASHTIPAIALGPALGGLTIGAGLGYASVGWVGAGIVAVGLALTLLFPAAAARGTDPSEAQPQPSSAVLRCLPAAPASPPRGEGSAILAAPAVSGG